MSQHSNSRAIVLIEEPHRRHKIVRSPRYDAYYCVDCDEWLEYTCFDRTCEYCHGRPDRPSQMI